MTLEITQYPVFEADQVLSQKHLNNMISYLEEQDRVSRTALLGMGIACGLEIARPKRTEIDISCGTAITSLGFLITLEDTTYTHYKHSTLSDKFLGPVLEPDHYLNTIYDEVGIYRPFKECLELLPLGTKDPEGLVLTAPIIEQSVVMLLLEVPLNDLKNCTEIDCEDKGKKLEFRLRALLIKKGDIEFSKIRVFPCGGYLKELRLQKLSSKRSLMVTGRHVLDSFNTKIRMAKPLLFKSNNDLYKLFEDEFPEIIGFNGLKDVSNRITAVHRAHKDSIYIQYVWDWISDLIATYNEIVRFNSCHPMVCCPKANLFPFHVLLGLAEFDTKSSLLHPERRKYRTPFIKTGALASSELELRNELKGLLIKLIKQLQSFDLNKRTVKEEGIKITPSKLGDSPLSDRAIPFYYNKIEELNKSWSPTLTSRGLNTCILSYLSSVYNKTDDHVNIPLLYDTEPYNFYRVEGHIGQSYNRALSSIISRIQQYRLPFKVVALNALSFTKKTIDISKHEGKWGDLELEYDLAKSNFDNILKHLIDWATKANEAKLENIPSVSSINNFLIQYRNLFPNNLQDFLLEYININSRSEELKRFIVFFRFIILKFDGILGEGREDFIDHLDEIKNLLIEDSFGVIYKEALQRWDDYSKEIFLSKFLIKHPGIEHKAGVPKGGTLILIYKDSSIFDKRIKKPSRPFPLFATINATIKALSLKLKDKERESLDAELKLIAKPLIDADLKEEGKECREEVDSTIDQLRERLKFNAPDSFVNVIDSVLDDFKPGRAVNPKPRIPERVILADFYLPYICCSDSNNINIVLPAVTIGDFDKKDFDKKDFFTN